LFSGLACPSDASFISSGCVGATVLSVFLKIAEGQTVTSFPYVLFVLIAGVQHPLMGG